MRIVPLIILATVVLGIAPAGEEAPPMGAADTEPTVAHPFGRRGDGSGRYLGAKPVAEWDDATGKNIRWRAPLDMFGCPTPVVVKGKVVVLSNPGIVTCFDAATGDKLWEHDEFDLLWPNLAKKPEAEKAEYKKLIYDIIHARMQDGLFRLKDFRGKETEYAYNPHYTAWRDEALKGRHPSIVAKHDDGTKFDWYPKEKLKGKVYEYAGQQKLIDAGIVLNHNAGRVYMQWTGMIFCPPLTDGERIYVQLPGTRYVAYSLDGKRLWVHTGARKGNGPEAVKWREYHMGALIDGHWVIQARNMSKCYQVLDCATGKPVFKSKAKVMDGRCRNQGFVRLTHQGKPFIVDSAGKLIGPDWNQGAKIATWKAIGGNVNRFIGDYGAIQAGNRFYTAWGGYAGKKEAGIRVYAIEGEAGAPKLKEVDYIQYVDRSRQEKEVQKFYGKDKSKADLNWRGLTVGDKHIYACGAKHWVTVVNRESGKVVNVVQYDPTFSDHTNQGIFADGKVYLPTWSGLTAVFDDTTGKLIRVNRTEPILTGSMVAKGDALYVRGMFNLYCIGKK